MARKPFQAWKRFGLQHLAHTHQALSPRCAQPPQKYTERFGTTPDADPPGALPIRRQCRVTQVALGLAPGDAMRTT